MNNNRLDYGKYRRMWTKPRKHSIGYYVGKTILWTTRVILFPVFFMIRLIEWVYHLD